MGYFMSEPLITHAFAGTQFVLALALFALLPLGAFPRFRFPIIAVTALIWLVAAWFVVQTPADALEAAFVWCFCAVIGCIASMQPSSSPEDTKPLPKNARPPKLSGLYQLILFHFVWFAGFALAFTSIELDYLVVFLCAWSFVFIWLAQTSLWPLMISYEWIGHSERKQIFRKDADRRK